MDVKELLKRLEENAAVLLKPVQVEIEGIGTLYVRRRTVLEFEQMSRLAEGEQAKNGMFAPAVVRLLCDEEGHRFNEKDQAALAAALSRQPEHVFHKLIEASDGRAKKEESSNPN